MLIHFDLINGHKNTILNLLHNILLCSKTIPIFYSYREPPLLDNTESEKYYTIDCSSLTEEITIQNETDNFQI